MKMVMFIIARDRKGLTLIELMIVLVLSMALMSAVYMTYQIQHSTGKAQQETIAVQQDLMAVTDMINRDLRNTGCDPSMSSTAGITYTQTGPHKISISMDLNGDGDTSDTDPDEQISYVLSGTTLSRNASTLVSGVTTLDFTYYDNNISAITPTGSGVTLTEAQAASVRYVDVTLELQSQKKDPDTNNYIKRRTISRIRMRNLGL